MISFKQFLAESDNKGIMSFTKGQPRVDSINGISFAKATPSNWESYTIKNLSEPEINVPRGLKLASGCLVREKDGRYWIVHPTNQFGGYNATFPKGKAEPNLSLQANAVKETWEESGILVKITGFAIDVEKTTSMVRYYYAKRIGGDPTLVGWESEKVSLVPRKDITTLLNHPADKPIIKALI